EEALERRRAMDALGHLLQRAQRERHGSLGRPAPLLGRRHARLVLRELDRFDLVDVRREEPEDPLQPRVRRDRLDAQAHRLEQGAVEFGADVAEAEHVRLQRVRIVQAEARLRILRDVPAALVEELERERHVPRIDVVHVAQDRGVRNAVPRARVEPRREQPLEAGRERLERGAFHAIRPPAPGPGVWSNVSSTRNRTATDGQYFHPPVTSLRIPITSRSAKNPSTWRSTSRRSDGFARRDPAKIPFSWQARLVLGWTKRTAILPFSSRFASTSSEFFAWKKTSTCSRSRS